MVEIRSGCGHVLPAMAKIVDVATPCGWCGAERRRIKAAEILAVVKGWRERPRRGDE